MDKDSWDKIEADSELRLDQYCVFVLGWEWSYLDYYSSDDQAMFVMSDIVKRCKALAGVE